MSVRFTSPSQTFGPNAATRQSNEAIDRREAEALTCDRDRKKVSEVKFMLHRMRYILLKAKNG